MVRIEWKQPQEVIQRLVARKFPSQVPLTPKQYRRAASKTTMAPKLRSGHKLKEPSVVLDRMPKIKLTPKRKASKAKPLKKKKKGRKSRRCKKFGRRDVKVREHTRNVKVCLDKRR